MSVVQIYLQTPTEFGSLGFIDEQRIRAHSATIDNALGPPNGSLQQTVTLTGAAPGALKYIFERIRKNKPNFALHIKVHDQGFLKAVAIYEAAELLQLQPAQQHIEGHIIGYISHAVVTPAELVATHRCFEARQATSKTWRVLVHQVAWNILHGKYAEQAAIDLKLAASQYPALVAAIDSRIYNDLLEKKAQHDFVVAKDAERARAKEERRGRALTRE
ncbi:hypothetical protein LTR36_004898 [Oleoguttula mirabilis]|uniref:Uncharacterized protein n=1 Tax=Oleoguttula mirabilis TaxID=1507867 RepID=A0AAV9JF82_9PEZI|nr:hypothetical protein LTR36_004898 [Oleoguttula mirabilis]